MKILAQALSFAQQHPETALVTVVATKGSTPRHAGAHMLVSASGLSLGTVGGGSIEWEVTKIARQVAQDSLPVLLKHDLVQDLAMCCGGSMEIFIEPLGRNLSLLQEVLRCSGQRKSVVIQTCQETGVKSLLEPSERMKSFSRTETGFIEVFRPTDRIILFGYGHLAKSIGPLAFSLGFSLVVCDDNETNALEKDITWAESCITSFSIPDVERKLGTLGKEDYLLVLTRDHAEDQKILEALLPRISSFAYLGMIGSKGKVGRFQKRILAKGQVSKTDWSKLYSPLGVDIGAETPAEIAISILAQLIAIKNTGISP